MRRFPFGAAAAATLMTKEPRIRRAAVVLCVVACALRAGTDAREIRGARGEQGANAFQRALQDAAFVESELSGASGASFLQVGASAEASAKTPELDQCEMCMFAVHQSQYGRLPPCGATNTPRYTSWMCVQVVRSMLRFARDIVDALNKGCYRYDTLQGWQEEKPCSAHAICGRLYNVYDLQHQTLCPQDPAYKFRHAVADPAPRVYNPLLPFAIKWYRDLNASSVAQDAEAGYPL